MRLWSLHPSVLDRAALVACWREALLAQKVLAGETRGYRHHPQLLRFQSGDSQALIGAYLLAVADEAAARGYHFDRSRITASPCAVPALTVTSGQLDLEWAHLRAKVAVRAPDWLPRLVAPVAHPLFTIVPGLVETWERASLPPSGGTGNA